MAIIEAGVLADRGESFDAGVIRRQVANGIGLSRITGDCKGLAPASAVIDLATRTACAWLAHPSRPAEGAESRRAFPDFDQRMILY